MYSYGDFFPVNNTERLYAMAVMLSTYIAYGLIMGRSATILASFSFRRQTFKQRFAIIRRYLVSICVMLTTCLQMYLTLVEEGLYKGRLAEESHQVL